jgi:SAM-dependent methyltransferase
MPPTESPPADPAADPRRFAPAAERNREPLAEVLGRVFVAPGTVLELASGTGQHAAYFGEKWPHLRWQPTDLDEDNFASITAWTEGLQNVAPPVSLDARSDDWNVGLAAVDYLLAVNLIHIAPVEATRGLLAGAGRCLRVGGKLALYGPFVVAGEALVASNVAFDESLRSRDPRWGIRSLDEVAATARTHGLSLVETVRMPANNLTVIFEKQAT